MDVGERVSPLLGVDALACEAQGAAERVRRGPCEPLRSAAAHLIGSSWAWANAFRPSLV